MKFIQRIKRIRHEFEGVSYWRLFELALWRKMAQRLHAVGVIDDSGFLALKRGKAQKLEAASSYSQLVCTSGFGYSGSGAVQDILSEYDDVRVVAEVESEGSLRNREVKFDFEFQLLRMTCGVFYFEKVLGSHFWSDHDFQVHHFISAATSLYYDAGGIFNEDFIALTRTFLENILAFKIPNKASLHFFGAYPSIGNRGAKLIWGNDNDYCYGLKPMSVTEYRVVAQKYVLGIIRMIPSKRYLVLDQLVSDGTSDIKKYQDYLGDVKVISVRRDPRDILAFERRANEGWIPHEVSEFIYWYRVANECNFSCEHPSLLKLRFEDLVHDYEAQVKKIEGFLGLNPEMHTRPKTAFDPMVSIRNVGIYREWLSAEESAMIVKALPKYCWRQ